MAQLSFSFINFIGYIFVDSSGLLTAKGFDCVDHNKLWKILKEMGIPDHLTCLLRNLFAGQEATVRTGPGTTDWFQIRKGEYIKAVYCHPAYLTYMQSTSWETMAESVELKSLLMKVQWESEKVGLKLNIKKMKIMASGPISS